MTVMNTLPTFYQATNASTWSYRADTARVRAEAETWRQKHKIKPATTDTLKVELLVIDMQKDFCLPQGALFVGGRTRMGAIEDTRRTVEFIYRNVARITRITPTMDTHFPYHIFFDSFWRGADGKRPGPFTAITADDIRKGTWELDPAAAQFAIGSDGRPSYGWARKQAQFYADQLERIGRYSLTIWPYHCVLGDEGHALVGVLQEARMFHSAARLIQSEVEIKGGNPWAENYSVFGAEVRDRWDGKGRIAEKNLGLVKRLIENDAVVVVGQAASHCFMWSVDDLLHEIRQVDPGLVRKVYVVEDCTSPVVVFDAKGNIVVDFTDATEAAFQRWRGEGVNVVRSSVDMAQWPHLDRLATTA